MKTLVLGLGNPILTDDGVGVLVAEAVGKMLPPDSAVEVGEACVGGLGLMERLIGYRRVSVIDALHNGRNEPGAIRRMTLEDLRAISPTQHSASAHDTSLVTALDMGRQRGLPLPEKMIIFGIEVENISDFSLKPTPAVARAVPKVTAIVLVELEKWGMVHSSGVRLTESANNKHE